MTKRSGADRSIRRRRPAVLLIAVLVLAAASCSKTGDDTSTVTGADTTTTTNTTEAATTTTTTAPKVLTSQDLSDALLTAEEVGAGFTVNETSDDEGADDSGLDVPPECKQLLDEDESTDEVHAERVFTDDADRELDIDASVTDDTIASIEEATKSCKEVPFSEDEVKGTLRITITPTDVVGDDAVIAEFEFAVTTPLVLNFKGHGVLAKRGGVGFSVLGLDTIDDDAKVVPFDQALIDNVARQLDQKIKDAQA